VSEAGLPQQTPATSRLWLSVVEVEAVHLLIALAGAGEVEERED
jgi:hypothetical protein